MDITSFQIIFQFYSRNSLSFLQPVLIYNDLPLKFLIYNGGKKVIKVVKFINENFCMIFLKIFFIKGFICAHIRNYFRQSLLKELRFITHYIIFLWGATSLQQSSNLLANIMSDLSSPSHSTNTAGGEKHSYFNYNADQLVLLQCTVGNDPIISKIPEVAQKL